MKTAFQKNVFGAAKGKTDKAMPGGKLKGKVMGKKAVATVKEYPKKKK